MVQPINYAAAMPQIDLTSSFINLGQSLGDLRKRQADEQAKQAAALAAQQAQQQYAADLQSTVQDGRLQAWGVLQAKYPSIAENLGKAAANFDQGYKDREFADGLRVQAALESGRADIVRPMIEDKIAALKNSGQNPKVYEQVLSALDAGDIKAAKNVTNFALMAADGKRFGEYATSRGTVEKLPAEVRKGVAEAAKVEAETKIKEIEAKFAPQKILSEIGLTSAQTGQATASAAASYASADSSRANAEKTRKETLQMTPGAIPPGERPKLEMSLRKEYADQTKTYKDTKEAYARIIASKPGAIGDISLIFGYMKMLDPGSVVREGEYATAEKARGVSDTIRNLYNKVLSGERLTDAQRKSMRGQAGKIYEAALSGENTVRKGVERMAKSYGLNVDNVFFEATETPPGVSPSVAGDEPPPGAVRPKGAR